MQKHDTCQERSNNNPIVKKRLIGFVVLICIISTFLFCKNVNHNKVKVDIISTDFVQSHTWYLAGPSVEDEKIINDVRLNYNLIKVTVNNEPKGEIELNVMITPCGQNNGPPTILPVNSSFLELVYKSSQPIKLQAREGNEAGTDCIHGGSHPRVDLPKVVNSFRKVRIPWSKFRQDELQDGKLLDINNICKLNFVNYYPEPGAVLEIRSIKIDNFKLK